jgi:hypothetical protein
MTTEQQQEKRVKLIDALNSDLQRKSNELFRYAIESEPYLKRGEEFFLQTYERLIPIDDDNAESLTAAIEMLDGIPSPGVWDLGLADMNYLNVRHLNRVLVELCRDTAQQLEEHLELAAGFPRIEAILTTVLGDTKAEIEQLEALQDRPSTATFAGRKSSDDGDSEANDDAKDAE